eukprot:jgi/Botrbrau1/15208/Bobra.0149s0067.1
MTLVAWGCVATEPHARTRALSTSSNHLLHKSVKFTTCTPFRRTPEKQFCASRTVLSKVVVPRHPTMSLASHDGRFSRRCTRRGCQRWTASKPGICRASLEAVALLPYTALGAATVGALWFAAKWTLKVQLDFVKASMLTNWVPKKEARVLQLGGGIGELFYYPKDTVLVTAVGEQVNTGWWERAGMQAAIPVRPVKGPLTKLSFLGGSSVDAVVSVDALRSVASSGARQALLAEVARVLKPGCPFIFIERVGGEGLAAAVQSVLGTAGQVLVPEALGDLQKTKGLTEVEWDIALEGLDPHVLGVAKKGAAGAADGEDSLSVTEGSISGLGSKGFSQQRSRQRKGFG